ncbi:isochorismate synthase [Balneolales bacterium ANBcel1]|nr:isochorismate synthase [Balneolales bacterium ANBcel1]
MSELTDKVMAETGTYADALVESDRFTRFFEKKRRASGSGYLTLSIPFQNIDPLAVLELNGNSNGARFYWERPDYEMALAAGGNVAQIKSSGRNRFRSISRKADDLLANAHYISDINHSMAGAHLVGGFSFFDEPLSGAWSPLGNSSFVLPEWLLVRDGQFSILNVTRPWNPRDEVDEHRTWFREWVRSFLNQLRDNIENSRILQNQEPGGGECAPEESESDRLNWMDKVEHARDFIRSGLFRKIVLARELRIDTGQKISCTKLIHHLRREYPSCYSFLYQLNGDATFIGSTPEKLLSLQSQYVKTVALAGSISRGKTATRDTINEKKLLESQKDLEEHAYVLDAIKEKLLPLTGSLEHPPNPIIKKYANVQHLCTPVAAALTSEVNAVDILEQLHPTPAVGGYPELEAVDRIQQLEQIERGWYAGPIGWFNTNRRAEFSVAIRSGLVRRKQVQFFAGCGIVEDSDPAAEWEETRIKFIPMQKGLEYAME